MIMSPMSDSESLRARPNKVPWPPIILLAAVITGSLLGSLVPAIANLQMTGHFLLGQLQVWLGWLMVMLAIAMDIWVLVIFKNHNTNIRPDRIKPGDDLLSHGETPHYHWRNLVSLPSSRWDRVVPRRCGRRENWVLQAILFVD